MASLLSLLVIYTIAGFTVRGLLVVGFAVEVSEEDEEDEGVGAYPVSEHHGIVTLDEEQLQGMEAH